MASAVVPDANGVSASRRACATRIVGGLCGGLLLFSAVRVAPLAAGLAGVQRPGYPSGIIPSGSLPLAEIEVLTIFALLWPPTVAVVWWWARRRAFAGAAAITFLALGCEDLSTLFIGGTSTFEIGAKQPGSLPAALAAVLAVLALMGAGLAWHSGRNQGPTERAERAADRKNIGARLMVLGAVVFALSVLVAEGWSLYLKVMEQNPTLRHWVLRSDRALRKMSTVESPLDRRVGVTGSMIRMGMEYAMTGRYLEARRAYETALFELDALAREDPDRHRFVFGRAMVANNLAWLLVTCPDASLRDPARGLELAELAVALVPEDANSLNTLAMAYYRTGDYDSARKALDRSMKRTAGGYPLDWYLRAMILAKQGAPDEARVWYDQARNKVDPHYPRGDEVQRFQAEAAVLLGMPPPPGPNPGFRGVGTSLSPGRVGPPTRPPGVNERGERD